MVSRAASISAILAVSYWYVIKIWIDFTLKLFKCL